MKSKNKLGNTSSTEQKNALLVIFGTSKSGKSSTLRALIQSLIAPTPFTINRDVKMIVYYRGKYIYFSTQGDTFECCAKGVSFFEDINNVGNKVLLFDGKTIKPMVDSKYLEDFPPSIYVTASRTSGGPLDVQMGYMRHCLENLTTCIWIKKEHFSKDKEKEYLQDIQTKTQYMKRLIDQIIDRKL